LVALYKPALTLPVALFIYTSIYLIVPVTPYAGMNHVLPLPLFAPSPEPCGDVRHGHIVGVTVRVNDGVMVLVSVTVGVAVRVSVPVAVTVHVDVGVMVSVTVLVAVEVTVMVFVIVRVGTVVPVEVG
jgi:hypothetical protein